MPYKVLEKKIGKQKGFKVCKKEEKTKCFSKKLLSKKQAKKQKIAIILSELRTQKK